MEIIGKAGWKTSEFWVTLVTAVSGVLVALGVIDVQGSDTVQAAAQIVAASVTGIVSAVYTAARVLLKKGTHEAIASVAAAKAYKDQ